MKGVAGTIGKIKEFRKGITLDGISVRDLIVEGRREYRRVDGIGAPKESGKKGFPVAPVGFPPVTRGQLRKVGEKIAGLPGVERVILFGSYARGNPTPDSDVDLLVIWKTRHPLLECRMRISTLFLDRSFPMDVVVRTPRQMRESLAGFDPFIQEVQSSGKVLYEKKG